MTQRAMLTSLLPPLLCTLLTGPAMTEDSVTRGIGVYPGDPAEDFAPTLVPGSDEVRNLALHRAATQSSAHDYDHTAQLVTDGIVAESLPRWLSVTTSSEGEVPKRERSFVVDDNMISGIDVNAPGWIEIEIGGAELDAVDRIELGLRQGDWMQRAITDSLGLPPPPQGRCLADFARPLAPPPATGAENREDGEIEWSITVPAEGHAWVEVARSSMAVPASIPPPPIDGGARPFYEWNRLGNLMVWTSVDLAQPSRSGRFRIHLEDLDCQSWQVAEVRLLSRGELLPLGGPSHFTSAWKSEGLGEEWVAVDLGVRSRLDRVVLHWLRHAAEGSVELSDDGEIWTPVTALEGAGGRQEIRLPEGSEGRHVRVLMTRPASPDGYLLSELEVFGVGGLRPEPRAQPAPKSDGSLHLAGGNWRLQRDSLVNGDGEQISLPGYADDGWLPATVPGTVLVSYFNAGALPDLNFGDHELAISDAFFHSDFWYRNEIEVPALAPGRRAFLDFDGVNWKARVYVNGTDVGRIEGAFARGRFDVTEHLRPGTNALAVRIEKPASPGAAKQHDLITAGQNGGALGADNPSYHASIGWDWIPTIRGRNNGLWNDVHLTLTGPVTVDDPYLSYTLPLPDTSTADARLEVTLTNHAGEAHAAVLRGRLGEVSFEQPVELAAGATETLTLDPASHPQLRLVEPSLWWPNGHGEPHLYDVTLEAVVDDAVSDTERFHTGVRQVTYRHEPITTDLESRDTTGSAMGDSTRLHLEVNGRRVVPRGGNWGHPEANLRYRAREYDAAMRYHRDMNFTMVRNWVGQTGDDELYEAADRHGLLVWQDFWLANPWDGPDPADEALFVANARDTIRRIRNHPSVALYCGRNEGHPPPSLDRALAEAVAELHPGLPYIPNSMFSSVSGGGPYGVHSREYYFSSRATRKLHSELGMTSVVTLDSLRRMMPEEDLWPMSLLWGIHDFNLDSNQRARDYVRRIEQSYGGAEELEEWVATAQLVNYDGYRAMFEAQSRERMGLQLWMSHPAWPSLTWQTYDYYFNPHASYFGSKKGAEPLHVQWNPLTDEVEVVNYGVDGATGLRARAEILNLDGSVVWSEEAEVDSAYDSTVSPFELDFSGDLTPVHFIRLRLERDGEPVSENFYWRGTENGNYRALRTLADVPVKSTSRIEQRGDRWVVETELENPSATPALGVRVVVLRERSGDPILPVLHDDNFVALMPGERRVIRSEMSVADARGEEPSVVIEGYNVARAAGSVD